MKIKVYSILRIRCHFWVADFQENDTPSLVPSSTNKTGFPPSRKDVVNGRHTICRAFNIRKPHVQRFFGGWICIQTKHVEGRSLINAASDAHMRKNQCLQFLQVSTFSSSSVLCYFFGETTPKGCNHSESRISQEHLANSFPPQGPKHHWLHQTWRGQQKGWVGHLTWCLDSTGPLSQKWGKKMGDNMGLVTSSQLLRIQVLLGETWQSCQKNIEVPKCRKKQKPRIYLYHLVSIKKQIFQNVLYSSCFVFQNDFLRLPGSACCWNDLTCTRNVDGWWWKRCIQNLVVFREMAVGNKQQQKPEW